MKFRAVKETWSVTDIRYLNYSCLWIEKDNRVGTLRRVNYLLHITIKETRLFS